MALGRGVGTPPPILRVGNAFLRVREGFCHEHVHHQENEFAKDANIEGNKRRLHTNTIDGGWGIL